MMCELHWDRFALTRAARCLREQGLFVLLGAVPVGQLYRVLQHVTPTDSAEVHWTLGVDVPGLSALISSVSDEMLGAGRWAPVGGAAPPATHSRMIRTTPAFKPSGDSTHIDAGVQLLELRGDRPSGDADWSAYPWNITERQSYAADVRWASRSGTPHQYEGMVARTLPAHPRSPRLGLTFLTSFTNCSYREVRGSTHIHRLAHPPMPTHAPAHACTRPCTSHALTHFAAP